MGNYQDTFTNDDLAVMQNMVIKGNSRAFETLNNKLGMVEQMSEKGLTADFVADNQNYVINADLAEVHRVIETYMQEPDMFYLVAGDGNTQLSRVNEFAEAIGTRLVQLDIDGNTQ